MTQERARQEIVPTSNRPPGWGPSMALDWFRGAVATGDKTSVEDWCNQKAVECGLLAGSTLYRDLRLFKRDDKFRSEWDELLRARHGREFYGTTPTYRDGWKSDWLANYKELGAREIAACEAVGVPWAYVKVCLRPSHERYDEDFHDRQQAIVEEACSVMEDMLDTSIMKLYEKGDWKTLSRTILQYLEQRHRTKWSRSQKHIHEGEVNHNHRVSKQALAGWTDHMSTFFKKPEEQEQLESGDIIEAEVVV